MLTFQNIKFGGNRLFPSEVIDFQALQAPTEHLQGSKFVGLVFRCWPFSISNLVEIGCSFRSHRFSGSTGTCKAQNLLGWSLDADLSEYQIWLKSAVFFRSSNFSGSAGTCKAQILLGWSLDAELSEYQIWWKSVASFRSYNFSGSTGTCKAQNL